MIEEVTARALVATWIITDRYSAYAMPRSVSLAFPIRRHGRFNLTHKSLSDV
jgi:hypothetical protein